MFTATARLILLQVLLLLLMIMIIIILSKCSKEEKRVFFPQPIFTMSAQQNQLQNVTHTEFLVFKDKYRNDDVSPSTAKLLQFVVCTPGKFFFSFYLSWMSELMWGLIFEILKIKPTRKTCSESTHFGSFRLLCDERIIKTVDVFFIIGYTKKHYTLHFFNWMTGCCSCVIFSCWNKNAAKC